MNIQQLDVCAVIQASYGFINGTASDIVCYECIYARYEQEVSPGSIFRDPVCKKKVEKSVSFLFFFFFSQSSKISCRSVGEDAKQREAEDRT